MTKTKMRAKIFAALLGLSMVVPTLFTTTVKATEMEGVTVSDNEIEVTVCTDEVETDETQLDTEATVAEIKNSPVLTLNTARQGDKLTAPKDEKWYQFTLTEQGYFYVDLKLNDAADPSKVNYGWNMYIYKGMESLDTSIKEVTSILSGGASSPILSMGTGTYYVKICARDSYSSSFAPVDVPFDITANFVGGAEWEQEDNDSNVTANTIKINEIYKGGCYYSKDEDWYKFTTPTNGYFEVQFGINDLTDVNNVDYGWNVGIYDSDLSCIRTYEGIKTNQIQSTLASDKLPYKAGTYYIKIYAKDSYSSSFAPVDCYYDLKVKYTSTDSWEAEYNDDNTKADALNVGAEKLGLLLNSKDEDWYGINVSQRGKISLSFALDSSVKEEALNDGWKIVLYDSELEEITSKERIKTNLNISTDTLNPGIYYVKVKATDTYSASFAPVACIYHLKADLAVANQRSDIESFVGRMYTVALGRDAEAAGLQSWSDKLQNGTIDGAGIAQGFIASQEFKNRNLSNSNYIDTLYRTFFNREPDQGGKSNWLSQLNKGVSRTEVLAGFVNSNEFANLCDSFHIARGTMQSNGSSIYRAGVRGYVLRMYTKALNRDGETVGVEDWTNRINTGAMSAEAVAKSFFSSDEFVNRNLSNEDYVETLYQTFMDRASDPTGKADWVNKLNSGVSRQTVLEGFSRSTEFNNIMKSFGL